VIGGRVGSSKVAQGTVRVNRRWAIVLIAIVVLTVAINVALFLRNRLLDQPQLEAMAIVSPRVTAVVPLGDGRMLASTIDDRVLLFDGDQVVAEKQFEMVVGGLAVGPQGDKIYVGTSDGKVTEFDLALRPLSESQVSGRVVGLKATESGAIYVASGVATRTDRFYISRFEQPGTEVDFTHKAEFTVHGLEVAGETGYYGTGNSRIVALGSDGEALWTSVISFPVDRLLAIPALNQLLVSDERGNLVLLDGDGLLIWQMQPTAFRLKALAYDPIAQVYLAGDEQGTVVGLDAAGTLLSSVKIGDSPIAALVAGSDGAVQVVPLEGQWFRLDASAMSGAGQAGQLRWLWLLGNVALLLLLGLVLLRALEAWWSAAMALSQRIRRAYVFYLFVFPSLALIVLFTYYPAILAFNNSLTNMSLRRVTQFVGLENYFEILTTDFYFRVGLWNLVIIVTASVLKTLTVPLLIAELIFWLRNFMLKYFFRTLFIFPAVVPGLVTILLWRMIYAPNIGLLNQILRSVGLSEWEMAWLGNENTALLAVIAAGFPYVNIFAFLIYTGGLLDINPELFDAAAIDGANTWSRFWHIDVPLLEQQFRLLLFFTVSGAVQGFASIWVYTRGGPGYATYTPALQMYRQLQDTEYGYGSAIGVLLFLMIFLATLVILRFRRTDTLDARS
jgi:raffinose/stachyose/melibiose transport system permease protein